MDSNISLTNHFLIAMPSLADPNFTHTVTYICEHNAEGAMGVVINRPMGISLAEILPQLKIEAAMEIDPALIPLYEGGPVQREHGFVLHRPPGEWRSSLGITKAVTLTTSQDILSAIAHGRGPDAYLIALGYAGWGPGQLEEEIAQNSWLSGPADPAILFDLPDASRWQAAAAALGVDLNLLSSEIGHA